MFNKLKSGGILFLHLPSYKYSRWFPENFNNSKNRESENHHWIFYIDEKPFQHEKIINISQKIKDIGFSIDIEQYVGDDSIIIIAKKK